MKPFEHIGKNIAIYLGSAWVIMEASNFFIDRYDLEPLLLDILIIFLVFGVLSCIIYSTFTGRWNKKAMLSQVIILVLSVLSVGYFIGNPNKLNPQNLRFIKINDPERPLINLESVAVLPIQNNLPTNENDYLLAALHDGIITELGKLGTLKTISRTSMQQYEQSPKSLKQIGEELGVHTLLESSLSPLNEQYTLRVRLLEARSEHLIWNDEFTIEAKNMPQLFETVSHIIATKLDPNAVENVRIHEEVNPEAYKEIVQGNLLMQKFTAQELQESLVHFQRAIQLDSTNLEGYLGVSKAWIYLQQLGVVDPKEARPHIYDYFEFAKTMDDKHWQIYYLDGIIKFFIEFDFDAGIQLLLKSLELNPNNSDTRSVLAHCYMISGDWNKAWEQMRYAKEIDPLNPQVIGFEFIMLGQQGKFLSAMKSMNFLGAIDPKNHFYRLFLFIKSKDLGTPEEAIEALKKVNTDLTNAQQLEKFIDATFKETQDVNETWFKVVTEYNKNVDYEGYYPSMAARSLYGFFPENDDLFFKNLNSMAADRHPDLPYYSIKDGNPLQGDPRYIKVMQELGFW